MAVGCVVGVVASGVGRFITEGNWSTPGIVPLPTPSCSSWGAGMPVALSGAVSLDVLEGGETGAAVADVPLLVAGSLVTGRLLLSGAGWLAASDPVALRREETSPLLRGGDAGALDAGPFPNSAGDRSRIRRKR
jgi:hypothetical protein